MFSDYDTFRSRTEKPLLAIALVFILLFIVEYIFEPTGLAEELFKIVDYVISGIFFIEYVFLMKLATDKKKAFVRHIPELVMVVAPFLRILRAGRIVRFGKILRVGILLNMLKGPWEILKSRSEVIASLFFAIGLVVIGGVLGWQFEHEAPGANIVDTIDGFWWAITTTTTVGYGDYFPVTFAGRVVGTILMFVGIGVLSIVTASVAAWFVEGEQELENDEIKDKLDYILSILEKGEYES